jgi:hypothetical protein
LNTRHISFSQALLTRAKMPTDLHVMLANGTRLVLKSLERLDCLK